VATLLKDLFADWKAWCEEQGEDPENSRRLKKCLEKRPGVGSRRDMDGVGNRRDPQAEMKPMTDMTDMTHLPAFPLRARARVSGTGHFVHVRHVRHGPVRRPGPAGRRKRRRTIKIVHSQDDAAGTETQTAKAGAMEFLQAALATGPLPATQVVRRAREHGLTAKAIRSAREALGVEGAGDEAR
jgi:hypothetical protein